jgi:hypothetical protein
MYGYIDHYYRYMLVNQSVAREGSGSQIPNHEITKPVGDRVVGAVP